MSHLVISSSHSLINVTLECHLNVRIELEDLLESLMIYSPRVQDVSDEALIAGELNRVSVIVIFILKESIVTLSITSSHLNLSDSGAICHMANHT